ncbi:MAG: DUF5050 domain-containing protein, partial [Bacillota bacterium]|nr:DUF5050 domain-containing protein [Bacillota bacterium]
SGKDKPDNTSAANNPISSSEPSSQPGGTSNQQDNGAAESTIKDIKAVSSGKWGNSPGNIANGGLFAMQEDYLFYSNPYLITTNTNSTVNLVRTMADGITGLAALPATVFNSLNVYGNYIYYIYNDALYRTDLNGENPTVIKQGSIRELIIYDGSLYYLDGQSVYKCSVDAVDNPLLLIDQVDKFLISEDGQQLVYTSQNSTDTRFHQDIYLLELNSGNKRLLISSSDTVGYINDFTVYRNCLYFISSSNFEHPEKDSIYFTLYKLDFSTEQSTTKKPAILDMDVQNISSMNLNGNYLYYTYKTSPTSNTLICRRNLDDNSKESYNLDSNSMPLSPIFVFGDKVYFFGSGSNARNELASFDFATKKLIKNMFQ